MGADVPNPGDPKMTTFTNGPAKGIVLTLARAPFFLRVVVGSGMCGEWDALDKLDDKPEIDEIIYVYRKIEDHGSVHIDYQDNRGKRRGMNVCSATYELYQTQPSESVMRNTSTWRKWAAAEKTNFEKPADFLGSQDQTGPTSHNP